MRGAWFGALRDGRGASAGTPRARSALEAFRDLVLAPPADRPAPSSGAEHPLAPPPRTPALAVLCGADDARPVAVAAGSLLAGAFGGARGPCALACVWTPDATPARADGRPLAWAAPQRLAASLGARGLVADACGRTAAVTLPAAPADAVMAARRALAAAAQAPAVLVLGGPRDAAFDVLLAEQDLIVVLTCGGQSDTVTALAVAALDALDVRAVARPLALRPAARALAGLGVGVPPVLRRALDAPLRDLR
jgi:hypothetical protein